jgi:thioredoxin reductase (NADPH)
MFDVVWLIYGLPLLAIILLFRRRRVRLEDRSAQVLRAAHATGLLEPVSLHPLIDPARCIGCGACVKACPEHDILGMISGRAELVTPADCIGHGACRASCPVDAITLVFGSATRGVDIPLVSPSFESTVPGVFIAGELGGMGLIRNAVEQGCQAVKAIQARGRRRNGLLDLVIIGAGPAGFAAALAAKERGMRYVTLEQDSLGGCVFHYPRGKVVLTQPVELPLVGKIPVTTASKEELLGFWVEVERLVELPIQYGERVDAVESVDGFLCVRSRAADYRTNAVLLAIGRRGTPQRLGVPGEDLSKVVYQLIEPEQYAGRRVLVVGGGDSALEAAAQLSDQVNADVTLSYRGDAFKRAKPRNRERVATAVMNRRLRLLPKSNVVRIGERDVELASEDRRERIPNDAVIVCAGGALPGDFLRRVGIQVETKWGTA